MRAGHHHPTTRANRGCLPTCPSGRAERYPGRSSALNLLTGEQGVNQVYRAPSQRKWHGTRERFSGLSCRGSLGIVFPRRSKRLPGPDVLCLIMPQNVPVSVLGNHAEKRGPWRKPAVFHLPHLKRPPRQHKSHGSLVGSIPRVTFHANLSHSSFFPGRQPQAGIFPSKAPPSNARAAASAFHAAPRKTIAAESCIHTINPIAAASPPYTRLYCILRT